MNRGARLLLLVALLGSGCNASPASDKTPVSAKTQAGRTAVVSHDKEMIGLFDRWEKVWHEGRYDLIPSCVEPTYIRHDQKGNRTVTREAYAAEIANIREERPGIRVVVYDHSFEGDRAWFRFEFKWTDPKTREVHTQAGLQSYRIADGKLAETWSILSPLGSAWPDAVAQEHWTSPPPIK